MERFGIVPMVLCMLSGVAVYVLVQQIGLISPLALSTPSSVYFDLEPMKPKK
jgi:hypothetical protein